MKSNIEEMESIKIFFEISERMRWDYLYDRHYLYVWYMWPLRENSFTCTNSESYIARHGSYAWHSGVLLRLCAGIILPTRVIFSSFVFTFIAFSLPFDVNESSLSNVFLILLFTHNWDCDDKVGCKFSHANKRVFFITLTSTRPWDKNPKLI